MWSRGGGGGATDIRLGLDDLYSRIIVAGGGGGGADGSVRTEEIESGGAGGGEEGKAGTGSYGTNGGGTQSSGGVGSSSTRSPVKGSFGFGASTEGADSPGGGGGWFGGATSTSTGGGGGSGYAVTSSSYKPSGYNVSDKFYMRNIQLIAGSEEFNSPNGFIETGHSGNGYARITLVE